MQLVGLVSSIVSSLLVSLWPRKTGGGYSCAMKYVVRSPVIITVTVAATVAATEQYHIK